MIAFQNTNFASPELITALVGRAVGGGLMVGFLIALFVEKGNSHAAHVLHVAAPHQLAQRHVMRKEAFLRRNGDQAIATSLVPKVPLPPTPVSAVWMQ